MEPVKMDLKDYTDYAFDIIKEISEKIGPRFSCSKEEKEANLLIKQKLAKYCDQTSLEEFTTHPNWFPQGILRTNFILGLLSFLFLPFIFPLPIISATLLVLAILLLIFELVYLKGLLQFLTRKGTSSNVFGIIEPNQQPKIYLIFGGHTDSAKQMRLAVRSKLFVNIVMVLAILFPIFTFILSLMKFSYQLIGLSYKIYYQGQIIEWSIFDWIYYTVGFVLLIFYLILHYGLIGETVVMGANDNLSGTAVVLALAQHFKRNRPEHTGLIFLSTGSEECGEKGAKNFAKMHPEYKKNSYSIIFECVGGGDEMLVVERDFMHDTKYSKEVVTLVEKAHEKLREKGFNTIPFNRAILPLGSSDASALGKKGFKTTFIVGLDHFTDKPKAWHSTTDTIENIDKDFLMQTIALGIQIVEIVDQD